MTGEREAADLIRGRQYIEAAQDHAVLGYEQKPAMEFGELVTLYEGHCRCGFKSFWHSYEEEALNAVRRHIAKARPEAVPLADRGDA